MKKYKLHTDHKRIIADTITPVSIYLKVRDKYPNSILLESSDYHGNENSFSYICFNPIATITIIDEQIEVKYPGVDKQFLPIQQGTDVKSSISEFASHFKAEDGGFSFINNGLFGYIGYDCIRYFENLSVNKSDDDDKIPDAIYAVYQNIIAINHFKNEGYLFCHSLDGTSNLEEVEALLKSKNFTSYAFMSNDGETSNCSDKEYIQRVQQAIQHCQRGDVFQMVLSRRFNQPFNGDEFNVYRALRSINPSPYLFYFDYGSFKLFGSSPEAQLVVKNNAAEIHPIAGTFKRTGNDKEDYDSAQRLKNDAKENAEHVMLVDLARNDLSRSAFDVDVEVYKEVQYYSHVIHLVSKVKGTINGDSTTLDVVADTFPAGTLSGAPKHRAMELIEEYEQDNRSYYGGCIGFMGFNGDFNHAIMIRTFCSRDNKLYYQAGAGVVVDSIPENELQEVFNKTDALRKAIKLANQFES